MNYNSAKKYLEFLNHYGVEKINIRVFNMGKPIISQIYGTNELDEIQKMLQQKKLEQKTVNCTFNDFEGTKSNSVKDSDIKYHTFLMIDIDPERPKGESATDEEKEEAKNVADEIINFVKGYGANYMYIDSGNGYHLLIPLELESDVKKVTGLKKCLLKLLAKKFNTETADVDTTVYNASRLGKLVGCMASKGESSSERPHRESKILSSVSDVRERFEISKLENMISDLEKEVEVKVTKEASKKAKNSINKTKISSINEVSDWLNSFDLTHDVKEGDDEGVNFFIFHQCPLKKHTNNQNGACLIRHSDESLQFKCHHASHAEIDIQDFLKEFPKPYSEKKESIIPSINLEKLKQGENYVLDQYLLNSKGLYLIDDETPRKISSSLFISGVITNIESKVIKVQLEYLTSTGGWDSIELEGDILQQYKLKQLTQYGIELLTRSEADVLDFLLMQKRAVAHLYEYSAVGWNHYEGLTTSPTYFLNKPFFEGKNPNLNNLTLVKNHMNNYEKSGDLTSFMQMINKEIVGTSGELALAIGVTPIILSYLRHIKNYDLQNIIINLHGVSSSGKSTMQTLIASLYGSPDDLVRTLNATSNALIKIMSESNGVPVILDELGTSSFKDLTSFFYQMASGSERLRLNKSSEFINPKRFSNVSILSSENSISSVLGEHDGLLTRYIELSNIEWTKSAISAERIKQCSRENNGVFIQTFLEKLMDGYLSSIEEIFNEQKESILLLLPEHALSSRISNSIALICTSSELINFLMTELTVDTEKTKRKLVSSLEVMLSRDDDTLSTVEKVIEFIIRNRQNFSTKKDVSNHNRALYGTFEMKNNSVTVNAFKNKFDTEICKEFGVSSATAIIRELKAEGILLSEAGRNTKRLRINKESKVTYQLLLPKEYAFYFSEDNKNGSVIQQIPNLKITNNTNHELTDEEFEF